MACKTFYVGVEPKVMEWARVSAGFSQQQAANALNEDVSVIKSWEEGNSFPTLKQLEKIAFEIYHRPITAFLLDKPPYEKPLAEVFRTLPETDINNLSPLMRLLVRKAKNKQIALAELNDGKNPSAKPLHKHFKVLLSDNPIHITNQLRNFIQLPIEEQKKWRNEYEALNKFREILSLYGIFVFQESIPTEEARAFALHDEEFPVIFLSTKDSPYGRIFSIFHELCHIFFDMGGIFKDVEINKLSPKAKSIETFCNQFAGEFLVPKENLINEPVVCNHKKGSIWDEKELNVLSHLYKISREVVLRRLLDLKYTSQDFYNKFREKERQKTEEKKDKKREGFASRPDKKCVNEKGKSYISLVLDNLQNGKINYKDVADFLEIKLEHLPKVIELLNK